MRASVVLVFLCTWISRYHIVLFFGGGTRSCVPNLSLLVVQICRQYANTAWRSVCRLATILLCSISVMSVFVLGFCTLCVVCRTRPLALIIGVRTHSFLDVRSSDASTWSSANLSNCVGNTIRQSVNEKCEHIAGFMRCPCVKLSDAFRCAICHRLKKMRGTQRVR